MTATPTSITHDQLTMTIDQITFTVTPAWNQALKKQIVVVPKGGNASTSLNLPTPPTGEKNAATVQIGGTVSTKGGSLNGYFVPATTMSEPIQGDTKLVTFVQTTETIEWLLDFGVDTQGNITIAATFCGIKP